MKKAGAEMGFPTPDVVVDGEVIEADPPRKLVQTWRMLMDPDAAAEGFTRLTYEIVEGKGGVTKLTVAHDVEGAPKLAVLLAGGVGGHGSRRRLELGAQRSEVAARDGFADGPGEPAEPGVRGARRVRRNAPRAGHAGGGASRRSFARTTR